MEINENINKSWLLTQDSYNIYKQCMYNVSFEEYLEEIINISKSSDYRIYVCKEAEINVGIIILKLVENETAEIVGIAVKKDFQKCSIGKFMINYVIHSLKIDTVFAETDQEAVGFYKKIGFNIKPFTRHFCDGDVVRYKCLLSK